MEKLKEAKWVRSLLIILCRTFYSFVVTYSFIYRLGIILDMLAFYTFQCLSHYQLFLHSKFFQSGFSWWLCDFSVSDKFTEVFYPTVILGVAEPSITLMENYERVSTNINAMVAIYEEQIDTQWEPRSSRRKSASEQSIFHFSHWNLLKFNVLISMFR